MKKTTILIADDHSLLRMGLASLIGYQKDMTVVGEAEDGAKAVQLSRKLKPDLVIMDLMMPVIGGADATRQIRETLPDAKIFVLTSFGNSGDLVQAVANGATGAMMKDTPNEELLAALRKVARGETCFPDEIRQFIAETPSAIVLTTRQQEILHSAARGLSTEDIARQFAISVDGVKKHFSAIFSKLGATTRSEAVAIALRKHLLKI